MQLSDARPFRDATSLEAVIIALNKITSNEEWFNEWRNLFQIRPDSELGIETLAAIRSPDSITGWTVANVAKRSILDERAIDLLRSWIDKERSATVRWRIAHVLGAKPKPTALETLLRLLDDDPDGSVRYGAIRSIIELAARADPGLRELAYDAVKARAEAITKQPRVSGELRTCLLVDSKAVEPEWLPFVANVVRALFIVIDNTSERDLWRRCLSEAEKLYPTYEGEEQLSGTPRGGRHG